ncbi:N-6 DNA methylase [Patescibacteria group bacterium]|nr:N-6 DNA methylase [Patescibacteria group bacterium]
MLNASTKQKINALRDILVGKIPDPKAQVEQITLALMYKFMSDIDERNAELLGGKSSFFAGDYASCSWKALTDPSLSGHERVIRYSECLEKMSRNPDLPQLFRDIFKHAFLPYRDPEVLSLFFKHINDFEYVHSEDLGDAFEYLLSILGSQGDAGQFRTPRHIIDFIVEVVDPQKHETVLDPACGTAGFLISAYKHILKQNTEAGSHEGSALTASERRKLTENFTGYDISPDMVRLSLVNMYLHMFPEPKIKEYDSLSSDTYWDQDFDVILANPPFMTPKGGIRPHNRFSIKANRAEVLFVDYIMEHLKPSGRAGVIVPEGIVFQGGTAYKELRKMLVEKGGLWAVVSLPAGVFQPYSGVKTSILLLDKNIAKQTDHIMFVKVEHDGFDLGAQRRPNGISELPMANEALVEYRRFVSSGEKSDATGWPGIAAVDGNPLVSFVAKQQIASLSSYGLVGAHYGSQTIDESAIDVVMLSEVCDINPKLPREILDQSELEVSFVPMSDIPDKGSATFLPQQKRRLAEVSKGYTSFLNGDVLLAKVTPCFENGKSGIARGLANGVGFGSTEFIVLRPNDEILPELLYYLVSTSEFIEQGKPQMTGTGGLRRLPKAFVENYQISLPSLEKQKEIVAELHKCQVVIDGALAVLNNYSPRFPSSDGIDVVPLGELGDFVGGYAFKSENMVSISGEGYLPVIKIGNISKTGQITDSRQQYCQYTPDLEKFIVKKGDIVVAMTGATVGKVAQVSDDSRYLLNQRVGMIRAREGVEQGYLLAVLLRDDFYQFCQQTAGGGAQGNISPKQIVNYMVPKLTLDQQKMMARSVQEFLGSRLLLEGIVSDAQKAMAELLVQ